ERVFRNAALPMVTSFLTKAIDFGFAALMLRILGVAAVGDYTWAVVMVGYFEILTNFGLNALIIREVSRQRDRAGRYLADAILLRLALCLVSLPVVALIVLLGSTWLKIESRAIIAFLLLALALIPGNVTTTLSALFYAWERIEIPSGVSVATALARVTLSTAALLAGAGIIGLAAIALLLNLVLVVVFLIVARRSLYLTLTGPVPADLPEMINESFPLLINNVLVTVFFKIDVLLLLAFQGNEALGYYATAYKWVDGTLIVPSTFTFAVYPALSRFAQEKGEGLRAAYEIAARVLLTIGIPITVAIFFLSGDLILLLGGQAYYPQSAVALAILIWFLPFSYLNGLTQYALIAVNHQRFITIAFLIATSFNLIANFLLIPRYSFLAAAVVTVLSEIILMLPFLYAVGQRIGMPNWLQTAGKPTLAGLAMGLVAYLGRAIEPHLALVLGAAVYVGAIWLLKTFSSDEVAALNRVMGALRKKAAPTPVEA
ncbi:MAG TPA: flippase, partial [Chloroflexota bacterium]|nr:flippase [Chloroflexota bacterium]